MNEFQVTIGETTFGGRPELVDTTGVMDYRTGKEYGIHMGQIKVEKNAGGIEGLCVIEPKVFGDSRGYFVETYNKQDMVAKGLDMEFVQDNQSQSTKGVLRGLHFQKQYPQGKLVRVTKGRVFDVAVDLPTVPPISVITKSNLYLLPSSFTFRLISSVMWGITWIVLPR
jgi:hypothetical protein